MAKQTGKAEKLMKELGVKIDELIAKGKDATSDIRDEIEDTAGDFKKARDRVEDVIINFREENQESIDEISYGLKKTGHGISKTFKSLFKKSKKSKKQKKKQKKSKKG